MSPWAGEEKLWLPLVPPRVPRVCRAPQLAAPASLGVASRGHSWLLAGLHPELTMQRALCSPDHSPALTIAPFKVPCTPSLGAVTGLRDPENPAPLCPRHPRKGKMGEQMSYSLLSDLEGSGTYAAHRASVGLAEQLSG